MIFFSNIIMTTIVQYFQLNNTDTEREQIKWMTFYFGVRHTEFDFVVSTLKGYIHAEALYLVSKETTKNGHKNTDGEHVHVCCQMSQHMYDNLISVMKKKYELKGNKKAGECGQYGKVKAIRDIDLMLAYCLKDGDYITNIDSAQIEELKKLSYPKAEQSAESKQKKSTKTWCEKTAEEIIEKTNGKEWNMSIADDAKRFHRHMFDCLGKSAKSFDSQIYDRLACGVYNRLPRTQRAVQDFEQALSQKFNERFGYQW